MNSETHPLGPAPRRAQFGHTAALVGSLIAGMLAASACGCQWAATGQNAQGVRLYEQGQFTAAMQQFQEAVNSDPTNPDAYYNLAATTHHIGVHRSDAKLLEQSEALYNQCLDLSPDHVDCHRGLAVLLHDTNRPDKAFALLKNWASRSPHLADARIEIARLYQEAGDVQTAQKYLEDAVQKDPNNSRAWLALGHMREAGGDVQQALANYQRSYTLNSMQPAVLQRIAALNRQMADEVDASLSTGGTRMVRQGQGGAGRY